MLRQNTQAKDGSSLGSLPGNELVVDPAITPRALVLKSRSKEPSPVTIPADRLDGRTRVGIECLLSPQPA